MLAQAQVREDGTALHQHTPSVLGFQPIARIAGVLVAPAQIAADAQAHVVSDRAVLPACDAVVVLGARLALGAEIVVEPQWTELRQRGLGNQQQKNA